MNMTSDYLKQVKVKKMQNGFKNVIRKIAAISAGALMTGATMFGAVSAVTLADYPAPFITSGKWIGLIVVGANAQAADIIGATDIAATLAQGAAVAAGTAGTTVTGGKQQDVTLNSTLARSFGTALTSSDLAGFQDTSVTIDRSTGSTSYNIKDELDLGAGVKLTTGLIEGSTAKDWGSDIWMTTSSSGQIIYYYKFKTNLAVADYISNASDTYPVTINFLGKNLRITGASATGITADVGEEHFMNVDDSAIVNGKTVKLLNVGSATSNTPVIVDVNGVQQTVTGTQLVNGLRIKVKSAFYSDTRAERSATLIIGTDATKTYSDSSEYIGESITDPNWTWTIAGLNTATPTLGVQNAKSAINPAATTKPLKIGESFNGPNGYFAITPSVTTTTAYKDYTFNYLGVADLYNSTNSLSTSAAYGLEITASGGGKNAFSIAGGTGNTGTKYTDKIFVYATANSTATYWANPDQGNHYQLSGDTVLFGGGAQTIATIVTPDDTNNLAYKGTMNLAGTIVNLYIDGAQDINMSTTLSGNNIKFLGAAQGTSAANEITVQSYQGSTATDVSTLDASGRTVDGIILSSIKANADGDQVKISVPSKVGTNFAVKTTITSTGSTVTAAKGGNVVIQSVSGLPVAKLDTEVADKTAYNMIIVGGPAVNTLTKELMPAPTIASGEATLKIVENAFSGTKVALLVVGYDASDTRNAASVLKDYTSYSAKLTGKEVIVKSTGGVISVAAPAVAAPATV
ncbi:MAG: S-layer protein [archaeon]